MNEFVIISKDVFEEMVGKFNHFSDRVNQPLDGQSGCLPAASYQSENLADASRQRDAGLLPDRA